MMKNKSGVTLIELLFVMVIFAIVMAGLYSSYKVLITHGQREFRQTESSVEIIMAKNIIERDLVMAGYGIPGRAAAYQYIPSLEVLRPVEATEGTGYNGSDTLKLSGTALGMRSRAAQGWTFGNTWDAPDVVSFQTWTDAREDLMNEDIVVMTEPTTGTYVLSSSLSDDWRYQFQGFDRNLISVPHTDTPDYAQKSPHVFLYGLFSSTSPTEIPATSTASVVQYYLGGDSPSNCEKDTRSLIRWECLGPNDTLCSRQPLLSCVLDFEVALGLDTNDDGSINGWDDGGKIKASTYSLDQLSKSLKQIRAYVLVQDGAEDPDYTYSNPDPNFAANQIRVGDLTLTSFKGGGVGRTMPLTDPQRHYRWKMIQFVVTPRNIR